MNLPNKLTMSRIILTIILIIIMLFPFYQINVAFPMWTWNIGEVIEVDSRYIISGILFVIASLTDLLDGKIARKRNLVTDFGKFLDSIADKVLEKVDYKISFSDLTFPHGLFRGILLEQIYRSFKIINNETYHK